MRPRTRLYRLAAAALAACSAVRTEVPTAVPNADFDLAVGDSVRIRDSRLLVRFDSVTDDSRCPTDVQCVWAGNATVRLAVDSAGHGAAVDLRTSVQQPSTVFGRTIELRGLRPPRTSGTPPPYSQYVATLRVSP